MRRFHDQTVLRRHPLKNWIPSRGEGSARIGRELARSKLRGLGSRDNGSTCLGWRSPGSRLDCEVKGVRHFFVRTASNVQASIKPQRFDELEGVDFPQLEFKESTSSPRSAKTQFLARDKLLVEACSSQRPSASLRCLPSRLSRQMSPVLRNTGRLHAAISECRCSRSPPMPSAAFAEPNPFKWPITCHTHRPSAFPAQDRRIMITITVRNRRERARRSKRDMAGQA